MCRSGVVGSNGKKAKAAQKVKNKNAATIISLAAILVILIAGAIIIRFISGGSDSPGNQAGGDLIIAKREITGKVKFFPYKAGKINMEVLAVKASDGTIRTAFNTCQVCHDSGRGYYEQDGNELVCQNCGNRFLLDQIEVIRGGCNPVPIMNENKTEDGENIIISKAFLEENKVWFQNWNK